MIAQLHGKLVEKSLDRVVVDVGGVGYSVIVSLNTLAELPEAGCEVTLKTRLQVREDAQLLYGFAGDAERRAFDLCLSVSGIGPKLAMALLSTMRPEALADAVRVGDVTRLSRTPGIGKRTAERILVELKDRIDKLGLAAAGGRGAPASAAGAGPDASSDAAATVASALVNLGYRADEAQRAAREATREREGHPLEALVRDALRLLTG